MYKVLVDGEILCDSRVDDLAIIDPVITLAMNSAGSFVFTLPPEHPKYDLLKRKKSIVSVWRDNDEEPIFQGIVCAEDVDMFKQKRVTCEGELSYFNDTVLRPARYQNVTPLALLTSYIEQHNSQIEESKRFEVGNVTVSGNINCYTNMQSTMTEIKEDLIDDFGGYMRVRYADGHKYIDYLADAPHTAMQPIELGKNLTDYRSNIDDVDIATRVVPLGQTIEGDSGIPGLEVHLTIESVNGGKDYLQSDAAIAQFGIITKTIEFSDVTTPSILKTKGQQYLDEVQFENVVIEASAVDFGYVSDEIRKFRIMDYVHVISEAHGMNKWFILTKMTINLNNPENDRFTLGKSEKLSLSARTTNISADIARALSGTVTSSAMQQAIAQATAMITGANGGFVKFNYDSNGEPYEILIMDTDDVKTAKKVWRWNQNGFGYSSNGYAGPYGTAITMDGAIVADYITTGSLSADRMKANVISAVNNSTGTLTINANKLNLSGYITATNLSEEGQTTINGKNITTGSINADLITTGSLSAARISGGTINGSKLYLETSDQNDAIVTIKDPQFSDWYTKITNSGLSANGHDGSLRSNRIDYFSDGMYGFTLVNGVWVQDIHISHGGAVLPTSIGIEGGSAGRVNLIPVAGDPMGWGYTFYQLQVGAGIKSSGRIHQFDGYTWIGDSAKAYDATQNYILHVGGKVFASDYDKPSDRRFKHDIEDVDKRYIEVFDSLKPKSYKFNQDGEDAKTHFGYIAQDVQEAFKKAGLDYEETSIIPKLQSLVDEENGITEERFALNYTEIMMLYDLKIRQLEKRIEELEERLNG